MFPTPLPARRLGLTLALLSGMTASSLPLSASSSLDLSGDWRVQIDPANVGVAEHWPARLLPGRIALPGSLQENRLGEPITVDTKWTGGIFDRSWFTSPDYAPYREAGNLKVPFWLQPETHYTGAAWFQREIEMPAAWQGARITLTLERPHWKTTVWLDGLELGSNDSLSVAHHYELGVLLSPGRHTLTVRVDNTLDPDLGENSHSVSDHTQGNWNGIVGRIALSAGAPIWTEDVQITTDLARRTARVQGVLRNLTGKTVRGSLALTVDTGVGTAALPASSVTQAVTLTADRLPFDATVPLGPEVPTWDEFSPVLHRLRLFLTGENLAAYPSDERIIRFGLREIAAHGRQLTINGRPLFLRGTLDCAAFPRTGHPPTDVATWKQVIGTIRDHGLNHIRFHSWCPPEAAFVAADELGVYLQVEVASWPNWTTTLGDGKPVDAWIDAESARIRQAYGNHPSFIALCACNEPSGPNHEAWLSGWVARNRAADPRRLYTAGAGWPEVPENDFHIRSEPRIQHWTEGLASRINQRPPETRTDYADFINERSVPVVSHEIGQWCVYPNFAEMPKYTGYLKPRNFEIFKASLEAHGLGAQAHDFLIASGKLQALCYKEDIESALRTPAMGGFQLLGLGDFPGQGTALVGVLDAFWEEKGYISPAEFRRFCTSTVPLARLDKRVFTTGEHFVADVELAHFGAIPLTQAAATWSLRDDAGHTVASGRFAPRDIAIGAAQPLGRVDLALTDLPAPARYTFAVAVEGTAFANDWDVWVYPPAVAVTGVAPATVTFASQLDAAAQARLAAGGTVWLMLPPERVAPDPKRGPIALGFSSIFWNTAWTNGQAPHTLGILCDPQHPALAQFPTEAHSNWQWWYVVTKGAAMILDDLPREVQPTVQVIDDWFTNRKLGLAIEARVGPGKLLVTSIDFRDAALDPVRRQLRASLLAYVASPRFQPAVELTLAQVAGLSRP